MMMTYFVYTLLRVIIKFIIAEINFHSDSTEVKIGVILEWLK